MQDIIAAYLFDLKAAGRSPATLASYCHALVELVRFLIAEGIHDFADVTSYQLRAHLASLQSDELKPGTIRLRATCISCFFNWLLQENLVQDNPMLHVRRPKKPNGRREIFTTAELREIFAAVQHTHNPVRNRAMLCLLLDCGLRVSELLALNRRDYDPASRALVVNGKGEKVRVLKLGNYCREALEVHLQSLDGDLWDITAQDLRAILARLGKKARTKANPHKFRHTFACRFLDAGGSIDELQYLLGHSHISTTMIYAAAGQEARALRSHAAHSPADRLFSSS